MISGLLCFKELTLRFNMLYIYLVHLGVGRAIDRWAVHAAPRLSPSELWDWLQPATHPCTAQMGPETGQIQTLIKEKFTAISGERKLWRARVIHGQRGVCNSAHKELVHERDLFRDAEFLTCSWQSEWPTFWEQEHIHNWFVVHNVSLHAVKGPQICEK